MTERYDVVIIGAGPGGYVAGIRAAQLGMSVAVVEKRDRLGGTCLNVGCIPSKTLLDSSELFSQAKNHFAQHGIQFEKVALNLPAMLERKNKVVEGLTEGVAGLMKKHKITTHRGTAKLLPSAPGAPGRVTVAENASLILEARAVCLATGSEPISLSALPLDGRNIVSSTEALSFDKVPQHLIVVGAGYIGLELGSVWSRLGAKVTVVEFLSRILPTGDAEIAELLQRALVKQGLGFALDTRVNAVSTQGGQIVVNATSKGKDVLFQGDKVLVAVGRKPFTRGLGLQELGVEVDDKTGKIPVDENFQTNIQSIYAIGDLIPGPMLAHKAEEDAVAFAERLAGMKTEVNYDTVPSVIYTWPEVASVGQTEEQLKSSGQEYRVGKVYLRANARARCMAETEGIVKILADARSDRVLGVHIFAARVSELIAEAVTVMEFAGSAEDIARICHAHPTLSESVREAALAVEGRTINA